MAGLLSVKYLATQPAELYDFYVSQGTLKNGEKNKINVAAVKGASLGKYS